MTKHTWEGLITLSTEEQVMADITVQYSDTSVGAPGLEIIDVVVWDKDGSERQLPEAEYDLIAGNYTLMERIDDDLRDRAADYMENQR